MVSVEWFAVVICTSTQSKCGTPTWELETLLRFILSKQQIPVPEKEKSKKEDNTETSSNPSYRSLNRVPKEQISIYPQNNSQTPYCASKTIQTIPPKDKSINKRVESNNTKVNTATHESSPAEACPAG